MAAATRGFSRYAQSSALQDAADPAPSSPGQGSGVPHGYCAVLTRGRLAERPFNARPLARSHIYGTVRCVRWPFVVVLTWRSGMCASRVRGVRLVAAGCLRVAGAVPPGADRG